MSLSRPTHIPSGVRDERADYIAAYLEELRSYESAGMTERANEVKVALRALGHAIDKAPTGVKERAVSTGATEKAVESDTPPKRRGRPKAS